MKYIYPLLLSLVACALYGQSSETVTGRIELNDGRFVIESFTAHKVGDSLYVEMGDLRLVDNGSPTMYRFSVPAVFALPVRTYRPRRRVDPGTYAGQLKVTVAELSEQEDELRMDIEVRMDRDVMNRRLSYLLIPELISGDSAATGAGLLVNGRVRERLYRRKLSFGNYTVLCDLPDLKIAVTTFTDTLMRYTLRMPYESWMDDARLDIHQVLGSPAGKEQLYTLSGAAQVKLQPREPYKVQPLFTFLTPEPEQKVRRMQGQAFLDFQAGRSTIVPGFRRNPEELAKIEAAIRQVRDNADVELNGVFIEGYASPEGSYASNERLARERSQALADHITRLYGIPADQIRVPSVAEDWEGLRLLVQESDLVRRDEVLAIIDSDHEPDRKEQLLRAMGWPWTAMLNGMFPQLRRVEYQVDFTVKDYSLEESRELAARDPELLSQRELFLLAQSLETGSPGWEQIFETIIRLYPDHPTALINYASLLLARGELSAAKRYLDRVADAPQAANNIGIYYLLMNDPDTAEDYLRQAQESGIPGAGHNLEQLRIKREDNRKMRRYANR